MTNIEEYKSRLTRDSADIFANYEKTGEDSNYYLGQIVRGEIKSPTLDKVLQYAQVFANPDFRGRVGSPKSFTSQNIAVVSGALNGDVKGLINNGFTSYIVADKTLGLSDLRETYASSTKLPFYKTSISADFSEIEEKLANVAKNIKIQVKKNSFSKKLVEEPLQLTKVNSGNSLCDIAKEIYQVAKNGIEGEFASELEKVTSSIFATLLVTRALDLSVGDANNQAEKKLDEALKLQFYSHLNGCFNSKQCSISTIVKNGAKYANELIQEMGYTYYDVIEKYNRLGTPIRGDVDNVLDALFGARNVNQSIDNYVDDNIDSYFRTYSDGLNGLVEGMDDDKALATLESNLLNGHVQNAEYVAPAAIAAAPARILLGDGRQTVILNPGEQVAGVNEKIAKEGEQIAKTTEKVVDKDARVAGSDEVVHDKGNAVNYNTLKKNLIGSIVDGIDERIAECTNRAEKQQDFGAIAEGNFWAGAKDGVCGLAQKRSKTESYNEGHKQGQYINAGIIQEIDKMYSADRKKLTVEVQGQGREITKKLGDRVANAFSFDSFVDFTTMVMSSLLKAFNNLKEKSSKSSKDDQTK